jgi:hypothetical protein
MPGSTDGKGRDRQTQHAKPDQRRLGLRAAVAGRWRGLRSQRPKSRDYGNARTWQSGGPYWRDIAADQAGGPRWVAFVEATGPVGYGNPTSDSAVADGGANPDLTVAVGGLQPLPTGGPPHDHLGRDRAEMLCARQQRHQQLDQGSGRSR